MSVNRQNPLQCLQKFARRLGWPEPLRAHRHEPKDLVLPDGRKLGEAVWYETGTATGGRSDWFLQFNEAPAGQSQVYVGAVYAIRYRIYTGWHEFCLGVDKDIELEAQRMEPWLGWERLASLEKRREFRLAHPECAGWSWKRIKEEGGMLS